MGYTHYFPAVRDLTHEEFAIIGEATKSIIANSGVPIVREYDLPDKPPEITSDLIAFNGVDDDGHETFYLSRTRTRSDFQFCKTARKPYDDVVTAVLCVVDTVAPGALDIGSDGSSREWHKGLSLAQSSCPSLDVKMIRAFLENELIDELSEIISD